MLKKSKPKLLSLFMAIVMLVTFMFAGQMPASALEITTDNSYFIQQENNSVDLHDQEILGNAVKKSAEYVIQAAHTLVWYSDSSSVGYWRSSPMVYMYRVDGNTNFYSAMVQAIGIWESALGIDIRYSYLNSVSEINTNSGIYFLGGTHMGLSNTEKFSSSDFYSNGQLVAGFTNRTSVGNDGTSYVTASGRSVTGTYFITTSGCILDDGTNSLNNYYLNTCIHELGHALGWYGHSTNSADIMYGVNTNDTSLSNRDILHIKQMYDIWY